MCPYRRGRRRCGDQLFLLIAGGEGGIRTHGTVPVQRFSSSKLLPQGKAINMPIDNVPGQPPVRDKGILARYPLIFYFIIAYTGSWLVVLPYLRSPGGAGLLPFSWPIPFPVSAALAPFAGPCLAAFIMTGVTQGSAGICRLLRRIALWRVGVWSYLFALVGIPAITVLGALVLPGVLESWQAPAASLLLAYPVRFVVSLIIGGPLGEEIGWRGFALPRLQRDQGPLGGSLILGRSGRFGTCPTSGCQNGEHPRTRSSISFGLCWLISP